MINAKQISINALAQESISSKNIPEIEFTCSKDFLQNNFKYTIENSTVIRVPESEKSIYSGLIKKISATNYVAHDINGNHHILLKGEKIHIRGEFKNNKVDGVAVCTIRHINGDFSLYEGYWKDSCHHGKGIHIVKNSIDEVILHQQGTFQHGKFIN